MKKFEGFPNEININYKRDNIKAVMSPICVEAIGYFPKAMNHYVNRENGCENYLLIFCMSGIGYVELENKTYEINQGEMCVLPKNVKHKYYSFEDNAWTIYYAHINGDKCEEVIKKLLPNRIHKSVNNTMTLNIINTLFNQALTVLTAKKDVSSIGYVNTTIEYLLDSLIIIDDSLSIDRDDEDFARLLNYVNSNLSKKIKNEEILSFLNISNSSLYRLCIKKTNYPPIEYIRNYKLSYAANKLRSTRKSINAIAGEIGYTDQYNFSRVFKTRYGVSPSIYRDAQENE